MWHHNKHRSIWCRAAALVTLLLISTGNVCHTQDPVKELRRAAVVRPADRSRLGKEFLAHRDKILAERVKALRTIGDLRRALIDWNLDPDRFGPMQKLDEKWRSVVGRRLTAALTEAAKSPKDTVRLAAACLIADMGTTVPALEASDSSGYARSLTGIAVKLSEDRSTAVRQEAVRALGLINADSKQVLPVLDRALRSEKDAALRRTAAQSLHQMVKLVNALNGKLQMKSAEVWATPQEMIATCKQVLDNIAEASKDHHAMRDSDAEVRVICVDAVRETARGFADLPGAYQADEFPPADRKLTQQEIQDISQDYKRVRRETVALTPLLQAAARNETALQEAAADKSPRVKSAAAAALEEYSHIRLRLWQRVESLPKVTKQSKPALPKEFDDMIVNSRPAMAALLVDPANALEVRRRAVGFLENLGDEAAPALASLTKALRDPDPFIRWAAIRTIAAIPIAKAAPAVADLARLLDDKDRDVRLAAVHGLERLGPRARPVLETLQAKIVEQNGDPEVRGAVMHVLTSIGTADTVSAVPLLAKVLTDAEAQVRQTAAEVLGKYGPLAEQAVPALRALLGDEDIQVRQRASDALLNILVSAEKL